MPVPPPSEPALLQTFAQSLHELREAAGRPPIKGLASATGYSETTVRDVLKGRLQQSRRAVQAVAAALGDDAEEWGRRWDALNLALRPGLALLSPPRGRCEIEGCPNKPQGRLCRTHRLHKQLYGDPTAGRFSPKTHPDVCSVEGCGRPYRARGLCKLHYDRHLATRAALAAQATQQV